MSPQLTAVIAASVLALAACNKPAEQSQSPEQAASAAVKAAESMRPQPGKYRVTTRITNMSIPGMPDELAAGAKKMFSTTGNATEFCLSEADAKMGQEEMIKRAAKGKCTYERFSAEGGRLDAAMTCDTGQGMQTRAAVTGTISPTGSSLAMKSEATIPDLPGGTMQMDMTVDTQRIGECG
jgi:Protein of unknown function (DUF3617)